LHQIKVCNVLIHLVAGWLVRLFKIPMGKKNGKKY